MDDSIDGSHDNRWGPELRPVGLSVNFERVAGIVAGHNINGNYQFNNRMQFEEEPDFIDGMLALQGSTPTMPVAFPKLLGMRGPI